MSSEEKNIRLLDKRLDMLFNSKEFTNALKVLKYKMERDGMFVDLIWLM
jgi:hypothetical protein